MARRAEVIATLRAKARTGTLTVTDIIASATDLGMPADELWEAVT